MALIQLKMPAVRSAFAAQAALDATRSAVESVDNPISLSSSVTVWTVSMGLSWLVGVMIVLICGLVLPEDHVAHMVLWAVTAGVCSTACNYRTRRAWYRHHRLRIGENAARHISIFGHHRGSPIEGIGFIIFTAVVAGWASTKSESGELAAYVSFGAFACLIAVLVGIWTGYVGIEGSTET